MVTAIEALAEQDIRAFLTGLRERTDTIRHTRAIHLAELRRAIESSHQLLRATRASLAGFRLSSFEPIGTAARPALRVLVVDDDADTATSTAELLTLYGFRAEWHTDGRAAVRAIRGNPPDIVLTDILMPDVSGFEIARAVRESRDRVFTVALTGTFGAALRTAEGAGFDAIVTKPAEPDALVALLRQFQRTLM
ncbi:pas pac sensor hybrid histidine kinase : Candidate histidine kinase, hybrid OS=Ramlibacter tataouinensis (strain ATCC BAA-407 / DSM 14655 / LMG 21543 / TTB310) GN=Rta_27150 PE=4 SV=1: Response_reg [Gemmata massiliana]|uniref:Response regulatory domain-containing protein n=1 Tax=Gemmata massiliana TaxID=1210884 RepID=A0A6P2CPT2_9BACT|nr:response regulator [Gemmata massiliana]VTR90839.1 pas pac sensor hybrid histidine kinase : Candidate histidine kinase, hybrid OS=Ramlibacter tataouinensis (strain ATCC BAA-407 / DSM 14655 / LMG 21543 / TTB310) GN=Rta_27150 PE=4 SV=1: Response_reg [Gemmata massiliana]